MNGPALSFCRSRPGGPGRRPVVRGRRGAAGFTLIELLVVLVILGLLLGLVGPRVLGYLATAKSDAAHLQIEHLAATLDLFRLDVGRYPSEKEGLAALVRRPESIEQWRGPYLNSKDVPADPWGRPYHYRMPSQHGGTYDLFSLGAEGGEGEDGDVRHR